MQQVLAAGLVDVIAVGLVPVFLGAGVRWFDNLYSEPIRLGNPRVVPGNRVTHLHYPGAVHVDDDHRRVIGPTRSPRSRHVSAVT